MQLLILMGGIVMNTNEVRNAAGRVEVSIKTNPELHKDLRFIAKALSKDVSRKNLNYDYRGEFPAYENIHSNGELAATDGHRLHIARGDFKLPEGFWRV